MADETRRTQAEELPTHSTLLGMICLLDQERERSETELIDTVRSLLTSGQVVLTGNFAGSTL